MNQSENHIDLLCVQGKNDISGTVWGDVACAVQSWKKK